MRGYVRLHRALQHRKVQKALLKCLTWPWSQVLLHLACLQSGGVHLLLPQGCCNTKIWTVGEHRDLNFDLTEVSLCRNANSCERQLNM